MLPWGTVGAWLTLREGQQMCRGRAQQMSGAEKKPSVLWLCCAATAAFIVSLPCCGSVLWTLINQCLPGSVNSLEKPLRFWKACGRWPKHSPALWKLPWLLLSACALRYWCPWSCPDYTGVFWVKQEKERETQRHIIFFSPYVAEVGGSGPPVIQGGTFFFFAVVPLIL